MTEKAKTEIKKDMMQTSAAEESVAVKTDEKPQISETWAQDIIEDLDDFIEAQGIYLRQ